MNHILLRDGKEEMRGTIDEIYRHVHRTHCYSVSHALEYEGYSIVPETPVPDDKLCMHDGCDRLATQFEADDDYWHDWIWCDEHAAGRLPRCEPIKEG